MTIPSKHTVGDTGHVNDHNAIVDTLTTMQTSITSLQTSITSLSVAGLPAGAVLTYVGVTDPNVTPPYLWLDTSQTPPAFNYVFYQAPVNAGSFITQFASTSFAGSTF